ncbi:Hypothetical predicted protein [Olea europaea subsp. europaea]|uniref:Uncharacterized protein n=1 Tax=Olea europaea subsp. europaea TaxID=158383 RepID=A0A8S0SRD9_OLEEU|nr:Hypothetical predicted protein [Olea europaea subsp. europaea]
MMLTETSNVVICVLDLGFLLCGCQALSLRNIADPYRPLQSSKGTVSAPETLPFTAYALSVSYEEDSETSGDNKSLSEVFLENQLATPVNECVKQGTKSVTEIAIRKLSRRQLLAEQRITT